MPQPGVSPSFASREGSEQPPWTRSARYQAWARAAPGSWISIPGPGVVGLSGIHRRRRLCDCQAALRRTPGNLDAPRPRRSAFCSCSEPGEGLSRTIDPGDLSICSALPRFSNLVYSINRLTTNPADGCEGDCWLHFELYVLTRLAEAFCRRGSLGVGCPLFMLASDFEHCGAPDNSRFRISLSTSKTVDLPAPLRPMSN